MSDGYSSAAWQCPFFTWDEPKRIHCEGGVLKFKSKRQKETYARCLCANIEGWGRCTLSESLMKEYEDEEREEYESTRKEKNRPQNNRG